MYEEEIYTRGSNDRWHALGAGSSFADYDVNPRPSSKERVRRKNPGA
jgi:hypothetical protein